MDAFFTKDELAKRWKCSLQTISNMMNDGKLKPSRRLPGVKIPATQVLRVEEAEPIEYTKLEIRRMKQENEKLERENKKLKQTLRDALNPLIDYMKEV